MKQHPNKTRRPLVLASILIGTFMTAVEATIVSTAMPSIVADLGGFSLYSWVFSVYLLMLVITIPIYGKLADLYGRTPIYAIGASIFLIGSLLCGFATSMTMMIIFRLIQGIGAGAIQPIATTIIGDIYSIEERGKIQGFLASVWGFSSIAGPPLGAFFVTYTDWVWVFWLNLPIGVLAVLGLFLFLHEDMEKKRKHIDVPGIILLLISISSLMVILLSSGKQWTWISLPNLLLLLMFILGVCAFIYQEKRAIEPVMPLTIWRNPVIVIANLVSITAGAILVGFSTYVPTYIQGVMGKPPMGSAFVLATMSIGWPIASSIGGRIMLKIGFRKMALLGGALMSLGTFFYLFIQPDFGLIYPSVGGFLIGAGMGFGVSTYIIAVQSSVEWNERGAATASNMFSRNIGSSMGVAMLGGILNSSFLSYLNQHPEKESLDLGIHLTNEILDPQKLSAMPSQTVEIIQEGLTLSLNWVYISIFILAVITLSLTFLWPKKSRKIGK